MVRQRFSIAALMAIVVIAGLNLMVYREVGQELLEMPPFFLALLTIDIGLFRNLVRPKAASGKFLGMVIGGLTSVMLALLYCVSQFRGPFFSPGAIGRMVRAILPASHEVVSSNRNLTLIEFATIDFLGIVVILLGGWLAGRSWRRGPVRSSRAAEPSPLTES
jgi:hypothetical protein